MLWRKYLPVSSLLTEVYGVAASNGAAQLQLVIVPGNPGNAGFYQHLMQELHSAFHGRVDVLAVSHLGHDPGGHNRGQVWCLDAQIKHKADFLVQHVLLPGRPPVVVLGHSIGAYIALHALQHLQQHPPLSDQPGPGPSSAAVASDSATGQISDVTAPSAANVTANDSASSMSSLPPILKLICLFPFFSADFTNKRQRLLRIAADWGHFLAVAAATLGKLPPALQRWVIQKFSPDIEAHAVATTQSLLTWSSARNNFHMALHEFRDLQKGGDWELLRDMGPRVAVVCAPNDMWFPRAHYEEMLTEVAGVESYWEDDLTHAFCVSVYQSKKVARMVATIAANSTRDAGTIITVHDVPTAASRL